LRRLKRWRTSIHGRACKKAADQGTALANKVQIQANFCEEQLTTAFKLLAEDSAAFQSLYEGIEDSGMYGADEFNADVMTSSPANVCFNRIQRVELDPHLLIEPGPLNELEPAPLR
jgi:hypothetical protein